MIVSVGIIIQHQSVFVGKRKKNKLYPDYFEFPGGKVEEGESSKEAIIRELREELSIAVQECTYLFETVSHYKEFSVTLKVFHITQYEGDISPESEYDEWTFFPISHIHSLNLLPGNQEMVDKLIKMRVFNG